MQDKVLLKLCLLWALVGIFLLILIANFTQPPEIKAIQMEDNLDKIVLVKGIVTQITPRDTVTFIDVKDSTGEIKVVLFDKLNSVNQKECIQVRGRVELYKGELEIIADEIIKC